MTPTEIIELINERIADLEKQRAHIQGNGRTQNDVTIRMGSEILLMINELFRLIDTINDKLNNQNQ